MSTITLTVPDLLAATYVVGLPRRIPGPPGLDRLRVLAALSCSGGATPATPATHRASGLAIWALEHEVLTIDEIEASALPPAGEWEVLGRDPSILRQLYAAPQVLVVQCLAPPARLLFHEVAARAAVGALATVRPGAVIVDAAVPRLMEADGLVGEEGVGCPSLAALVRVLISVGDGGCWLTTKGLGRWGLPELQAIDVPPSVGPAWGRVLTGLAEVIVGEFSARVGPIAGRERPAFVDLPETLLVTRAQVDAAYGEPVGCSGGHFEPAAVRLQFDPTPDFASDDFLTVRPPADFRGSPADHALSVCDALFGPPRSSVSKAS